MGLMPLQSCDIIIIVSINPKITVHNRKEKSSANRLSLFLRRAGRTLAGRRHLVMKNYEKLHV